MSKIFFQIKQKIIKFLKELNDCKDDLDEMEILS